MNDAAAQGLLDALAVIVLSDGSRHALEATDPKAFEQAMRALAAAAPGEFPAKVEEARAEIAQRRRDALLRMGGAHIRADGVPLCCVSYKAFTPETIERAFPPCYQGSVDAVIEAVEGLRALNPHLKITFEHGGCPRSGE